MTATLIAPQISPQAKATTTPIIGPPAGSTADDGGNLAHEAHDDDAPVVASPDRPASTGR